MATAPEPADYRQAAKPADIRLVEFLALALIWLLFFQRLIAIPFLAFAMWCSFKSDHRLARYVCWSMFAITLISPYDVRVADLSWSHRGTSQAYVSVVPYVVGMPAHTRLIEQHGEYYTGGCCGVCAFPPRSIVSIGFGSHRGQ